MALPPSIEDDLDDILDLPDEQKIYEVVKAVVLKRTSLSDRQRFMKLLNEAKLDSFKPS